MSSLSVGIAGLPNTGKTTLFNALSRAGALVSSYPYASTEPNVREVPVPDPRLLELSRLSKSARTVPAAVRFIDIPGLAAGANQGEGLGNRFLNAIRQSDALVHVVRAFEEGEPADPLRDLELFETELLLSDLELFGRELTKARKLQGKNVPGADERAAALERIEEAIASQAATDRAAFAGELAELAPGMGLLTLKPTLIVLNIPEGVDSTERARFESEAQGWAEPRGIPVLTVNASVEAELAELDPEEAALFEEEMGIEEEGLDRIVRAAFELLGMITFFTTGPDESRAWPIRDGLTARQAAGKIHTDFERGFVKAEVVALDDFYRCGSFPAAKDAGVLRLEGRDYLVKDGDVIIYKFATREKSRRA